MASILAALPAVPAFSARVVRTPSRTHDSPVADEMAWRELDAIDAARLAANQVVITRWRSHGTRDAQHVAPHINSGTRADTPTHTHTHTHHIVAINLRQTRLTFRSGMSDKEGLRPSMEANMRIPAGAIRVTPPGATVSVAFHDAADVLHLHLPQAQLENCFSAAFGHAFQGQPIIRNTAVQHDTAIETLGAALVGAVQSCGAFAKVYTEGLVLAIIGRMLALQFSELIPPAKPNTRALIEWRLNRTVDFIEANLESNLALSALAQSAGLSPMHFAAQFRAATGLKPHEYVLRRRIEAAKTLLSKQGNRPIDVAVSTGFRSQAHFTMVFKRLTGTTPARWKATAERSL